MKHVITALLALSFVSAPAFAINEKGNGPNSNSVNSNNSTNALEIYENTSAGKAQKEWAQGRVISACDSIQSWHPAFARGSKPEECNKG